MSKAFRIDLADVLRSKNIKLPGFVVRLLEKIIHQDWLNEFARRGYEGVEFAEELLKYCNVTISTEGLDRIPEEGRYTFACNHPLGGLDAMAIIAALGRARYGSNLRIQVNDFLMAIKGLDEMFVPVNKVGGQSRNLSADTDAIYSSDNQVVIFPAGQVSRKYDGVIQDREWGKSFIRKSVQYQRDVIPMHFIGENSRRFYTVDRIARFLGIKFPIAMALLPDEMYRTNGKHFRLVLGEPIPWQTFDSSRKPAEWAAEVRKQVYQLQ